jgi:acyl-CoA thioester hydrolase
VVRQTIEYRKELSLGARVKIGTRVVKLGRTSVTMAAAIFQGDICAATADVVAVLIDRDSRRPVELPEAARRNFSAFL